jgi:hypothetical protein
LYSGPDHCRQRPRDHPETHECEAAGVFGCRDRKNNEPSSVSSKDLEVRVTKRTPSRDSSELSALLMAAGEEFNAQQPRRDCRLS